jgi:hypothetical protein
MVCIASLLTLYLSLLFICNLKAYTYIFSLKYQDSERGGTIDAQSSVVRYDSKSQMLLDKRSVFDVSSDFCACQGKTVLAAVC